jgi:hypothetical protein
MVCLGATGFVRAGVVNIPDKVIDRASTSSVTSKKFWLKASGTSHVVAAGEWVATDGHALQLSSERNANTPSFQIINKTLYISDTSAFLVLEPTDSYVIPSDANGVAANGYTPLICDMHATTRTVSCHTVDTRHDRVRAHLMLCDTELRLLTTSEKGCHRVHLTGVFV